ncbi:hypothetical protein E1B28_011603 [Marasmius oreades]|uniref:glucan endo-1,3-beta-D-glucosidase n=1 Tax=Marasmius oreades TaxID=181124 RepID=A0A9P7RUF1_9AGAR|nr:uncharacterized protein E1B28_011603 [Marasmius oreades]KAG7089979.1 hypothetical protein E1B28_011603 [Marasmius oreades]
MLFPFLSSVVLLSHLHHYASALSLPEVDVTTSAGINDNADASNCFPAIGFTMPSSTPSSLTNWWCPMSSEYAFVGFSYEVSQCQSASQLKTEFANIKNKFHGRYVRLYGACDREGFYDDVVDAAWNAGVGVHALIWFGFDGGDIWETRRDTLTQALLNNPRAKFVTRTVQFGSEPMFDWVLDPPVLADQVTILKQKLSTLNIPVTVSDMAYSYQFQESNGSGQVMQAIDFIDAHMLPFFAQDASTADQSWPLVLRDLQWFYDNGLGKKMYLSENGWPSTTYPGVEPNSPLAVADVPNEKAYYDLLDSQCEYFKTAPNGGVGWFAHIYSDNQEPGYGIYGKDGQLKFAFQPRTSC